MNVLEFNGWHLNIHCCNTGIPVEMMLLLEICPQLKLPINGQF